MSKGELHANDDCMLINDEQDEVHALMRLMRFLNLGWVMIERITDSDRARYWECYDRERCWDATD